MDRPCQNTTREVNAGRTAGPDDKYSRHQSASPLFELLLVTCTKPGSTLFLTAYTGHTGSPSAILTAHEYLTNRDQEESNADSRVRAEFQ